MVALAVVLFGFIELVPTLIDGPAGTIVTVLGGSVFLYYFGKHIGAMISDNEELIDSATDV